VSTRAVTPAIAAPAAVLTSLQRQVLQRTCDCGQHTGGGECEGCKKKKKTPIQRHAAGTATPATAPHIVHDVLRSPGHPLDHATRAFMEPRFGQDFSRVRVHSDGEAAESARAVNALAYTVGNKIVFGADRYSSSTIAGRELLAHELAHTVQQNSRTPSISDSVTVTSPTDPSEQAADRAAASALHGDKPQIVPSGTQVARQASDAGSTASPTPGAAKPDPSNPDPSKKEPPKRAEQEGELGVKRSGFGLFDTELDRKLAAQKQPCRLTLTVNVNFTPQGPWPPGKFAKWQNDLIRIVTNRWSFRFLLAPAQPCPDEPCQSATAILKVVPVATPAANVQSVKVNYVKPSGTRSDSSTLYASDVQSPGKDLRRGHVTASHEAGHWLGLEHIHCNTNADDCYGTTDEESADVMGRGEIVSERDYAPFAEAITRITKCAWKVVGHGDAKLFGSSWVGPLALLGGLAGAVGGALLGAALGPAVALAAAAGLGALGALLGAGIGLGLNEVAR
jgi:Domain of unknown function (DUF4157)